MAFEPTAPIRPPLRQGEFVVLMALLVSLVALSIDSMLPALPEIGRDLGAGDPNAPQLVLTAFFGGLACGQIFWGPLSDSVGRKPAIVVAAVVFMVGCLVSMFATGFFGMLVGRALQGLGAAAPRTVTLALVRDQYEGSAMARIMSLVMLVFIIVPAVAPSIGQAVLFVAHWRAIFGVLLALSATAVVWFALRQPETLPEERRRRFSLGTIANGIVETCTHRAALGYTVTAGLIFGAFVGYLSSAQSIFQVQYGQGVLFPLYFGTLALTLGGASFVNSRLVVRYGMRLMCTWALRCLVALALCFLPVAIVFAGQPPLWALMTFMLCVFFCCGILFGNMNALAMTPLGHIAGIGSAVVGFFQTCISLALGTVIGQAYDGTVLPLIAGFTVLSIAAYAVTRWADKGMVAHAGAEPEAHRPLSSPTRSRRP
jgi:DHA1 family bicyclomycin/chloramphenicol resistance-like MFS transporter